MPPKRKYPFSVVSHGSRSGCKNPRLQKRDETEEPPIQFSSLSSLSPAAVEEIRRTVGEKIEHGKKLVFRALKKAKGFEKQKLIKRLKIARGKSDDTSVKKLELEFEVLKTEEINLNSLASNHILKTLSKSGPISKSPLFPPQLVSQKESEKQLDEREMAKRNIMARLYNSNPVKEEMVVVLGNVRKTIGMDEEDTQAKNKKSKSGKRQIQVGNEESESGGEVDEEQEQGVVEKLRGLEMKNITTETSGGGVDEISEEWAGIASSEESEGVEMDLDAFAANFEDRVAGSSDEGEDQSPLQRDMGEERSGDEEEEEGGEEEEEEKSDTNSTKTPATKMISEPIPKSKLKSQTIDTSPAPVPKPKKPAKSELASSATSKFLPTLMSGYISGSDSDIDADYYKDKEGKKKGPAEPKERKNRMGQQARRALWEKKFGKNANHVKEEEMKQSRKRIEQRINQGKGRGDGTKKENAEIEGLLHPSWEAARKAKEQQAKVQEAVMGKPMGRKIIFD